MLIEICLAAIAGILFILMIILLIGSIRSGKKLQRMQQDVHQVSQEATRVLHTINEFMNDDLKPISQEAHDLISKVNSLSSNIKDKVNAVNFLFRPLSFLNSKLGSKGSSDSESSHHCETVPQILKWIASSIILIKTAKEFIKHEK